MARPLEGIRVLDFSRVLAGPHCSRALADLGAEVIKIEPPEGDITRFTQPRRNSVASYYAQQNTGKANLSLDLSKPEAIAIVERLVATCDVVLENFRPGVMDRLGLGVEHLRSLRPELVYVSINGYGASSPWSDRRAYAPVVGAEAGLTRSQGDARGGHYANDRHSHADVYTALEATVAVLAALNQRHTTGLGQHVEVTMAQTMLYVNEHAHDALWDDTVPDGVIRSFGTGDYLVLRLGDGSDVIVSGHPAEAGTFEYFMRAIDRTDLIERDEFADVAGRLANLSEIIEAIRAHAASVANPKAYEAILSRHRLAVGRLRTVSEFAATDWAVATGAVVEVSDRGGGTIRVPQSPWTFSESTTGVTGEPRYRGEDNRHVLASLGYSAEEIDRLESDGVLSSRVPKDAQ